MVETFICYLDPERQVKITGNRRRENSKIPLNGNKSARVKKLWSFHNSTHGLAISPGIIRLLKCRGNLISSSFSIKRSCTSLSIDCQGSQFICTALKNKTLDTKAFRVLVDSSTKKHLKDVMSDIAVNESCFWKGPKWLFGTLPKSFEKSMKWMKKKK